jgi:hypothetical protein
VLTGCEQADRARTRHRPDVCRVNAIARPLVTPSLGCRDRDRQLGRPKDDRLGDPEQPRPDDAAA